MYRALAWLCLAACASRPAGQVSVSPGEVAVQTPRQGAVVRELHIKNNASTPVNVSISVQMRSNSRRLESFDDPAPELADVEQVQPARATSENMPETCKMLLKLRKHERDPSQGGENSAALRRRLRADERLAVKSWSHLGNVDIDVVELDCALVKDMNASMEYVKEQYGGGVEFVEKDGRVFASDFVGRPDDPKWPEQWGMRRVGVQRAWDSLAGKGPAWRKVTVAVIDTGVMLNHPDLKEHLWTNPGEIPGNGLDDDGNGFVDDVHGYDFVDNDGEPEDEGGHGTHCAGVIAAETDNAIGVAGVAGRHVKVEIMALRFLGGSGSGSTSDAIRALDYALAMGVPISSNSWGGEDDGGSVSLREAMRKAGAAGHLFVAAAGNDGADVDAKLYTPCGYSEDFALCVASTTSRDTLSSFSNYGPGHVHIAAPGSDILSTFTGGGYAVLSGTSMACPHVAGAAALLYGSMRSSTLQELRSLLLSSTERTAWLSGKVETGLLDVEKLLSHVSTAAWLSLGQGNATMQLRMEAGGSANVPLNIGLDGAPVGAYSADVVLEWSNRSVAVPVTYWLQGFPELTTDWGRNLVLDFGTVPLATVATRNASLRNLGNGTAKLLFGGVKAPFALATGLREVPAAAQAHLFFTCSPTSEGNWEMNVSVASNDGMLEPAPSFHFTSTYNITLRCSGKKPPRLELDKYSGVSLRGRLLEPSVHAAWEHELPGGHATAPLVLADSSNLMGCGLHANNFTGKILLVSRGECYFQSKALRAAEAGALGLVIYDNKPHTTLEVLATVAGLPLPRIATFMISQAEGLDLVRHLRAGEALELAMHWDSLTMWTNHPVHSNSSTVTLANLGDMAAKWSSSTLLSFGQTQSQFYDLSLPDAPLQWTAVSEADALQFFEGRSVDDEATLVKLPFGFPFYGKHHHEVMVSSNGVLVFDSSYTAEGDAHGSLPSTKAPNGLVAPFWDDLVCANFSRLYVLHVPASEADEAAMIFQFVNFTFWSRNVVDYSKEPRVTFEAQLFESGRVDINYLDFPPPRSNTKVGVETIDGAHGKNFAASLPFSAGKPFTARLSPWLVLQGPSSGVLAPSASSMLSFQAQGPLERMAWLKVTGQDASGAWTTERKVRLESRIFSTSWELGDWGSCDNANLRHRTVRCKGNDGLDYPFKLCAERKVCRDVPGWRDSRGKDCAAYQHLKELLSWYDIKGACTARFAKDGHWSQTACCACGGGVKQVQYHVPALNETCPTPPTQTTTPITIPSPAVATGSLTASMVLRVQGAERFSAAGEAALRKVIATAAGVAPEQVTLSVKKAADDRFLQTGQTLAADFTIALAAEEQAKVLAVLKALEPRRMTQLLLHELKERGNEGAQNLEVTNILHSATSLP